MVSDSSYLVVNQMDSDYTNINRILIPGFEVYPRHIRSIDTPINLISIKYSDIFSNPNSENISSFRIHLFGKLNGVLQSCLIIASLTNLIDLHSKLLFDFSILK